MAAQDDATDSRKIAVTTSDIEENFNSLCDGVYLIADADCFVDFDKPADTGSLLVKANIFYPMYKVQFTRLHAITAAGTANLYVLAIRY